jgi:hypothetical protein
VQCAACATMPPSSGAVKSERASHHAMRFETVTIGRILK